MIMNRIRIIGIFILTLAAIAPDAALADWKIYYTGVIGQQSGYHGRGSFATQLQCEQYRMTMPGGSMSYCGGFDTPTQSSPSGDDGTAAREQEKQRQLQLQREQKEKELELARQKKFAEEKANLLESFKGTSTGTLGLKGASSDTLELKTGTGTVDPQILKEQADFENRNAEWMQKQKRLIEQRLREPNKYASAISKSLKTNAPPPPWKTFNELQAGDVLLIEGEGISKGINYVDNKLSSGDNASNASHTVIYLKKVNGKKLFLDNQPFEGPRIISEDEFIELYGPRGVNVAKLAQPLVPDQAKLLFSAAVDMAQKNRNEKTIYWNPDWNPTGKPLLDIGTNYGAWGKENVVCSEADWALINATGRNIPKSGDRIKVSLGVDFSPADFYNSPYFLVTPLW